MENRKISKIIAVGRLHEQKNYPLLLKAMVDITKIKSEITLDIFGEGNQKKYLEGLVDEYGLANHVFLRGRSQSIEKQLQVADMFVMTSDYEGMPNALMEAMAFGVPCISSDCKTGPRSLIKSFENGLLFQTNNVEDLKDKKQNAHVAKLQGLSKRPKRKGVLSLITSTTKAKTAADKESE